MSSKKKITVGWEEWVALPHLGLPAIKAKIDTGAKTSSLHSFSVEPYSSKGNPKVRFGIHPIPERPEIEVFCTADLVDQREVISSNGDREIRYIIRTVLRISEKEWPIEISLTNRESMAYRMLIGRSAMEEPGLIVDPLGSCLTGQLSLDSYDQMLKAKKTRRNLKIGILSRDPNSYSTRRLVEAAQQREHIVEVINTTHCYINITSQRPEVRISGEPLTGFDVIIPRIGASITYYGMAVVRQFESMGVYCLNSADAIGRSRDKLFAHQLLARSGIGMPVTSFARSPRDTKDLINIVGGAPMIVKLLEGTQGKGVVLAETRKAAESVIDAFRGLKANILVQEYIKEAAGSDIRCFVIGNKVVAAMKRSAAEGDFRANIHRGGQGTKIKITPKERETVVKAAKALGLKVAGVDLLRANSGPKILEVNSSPGLEGIEQATKVDIAMQIVQYIEKNVLPKGKMNLSESQLEG